MKQDVMGQSGPDYALCRYGLSRMRFRGPPRPLDGRFIAFLGGTETFGKFLDRPFVDRVEQNLDEVCVNFGVPNAGIDAHARDATVLAACHDAMATVVELPGAQNQTNRFYAVHPRRNDRFVRPSAALETLYPDIDFADMTFTRHLLLALEQRCPQRFNLVRSELQEHWRARMFEFLSLIDGPKVLLWFADHLPPLKAARQDALATDPLFVTKAMVEDLRGAADGLVTVVPERGDNSCSGLRYHPLERPAAEAVLGWAAHDAATEALSDVLDPFVRPF